MAERPIFGDIPHNPYPQPIENLPLWSNEPIEEVVYQRGSIHESLAPYVDFAALRELAARKEDIRLALRGGQPPEEVIAILDTIKLILKPPEYIQIKSPRDVAAFLMADMGFLEQEEFRVCCLNTRNHLQEVFTVYKGSLNASIVRVGEIFKRPIELNSAAIIPVHNHPSGEPEPSPEDRLITREIVAGGRLLGIDVLDHLIIGQGKWMSLKKEGQVEFGHS